jgi:hypothetical protein
MRFCIFFGFYLKKTNKNFMLIESDIAKSNLLLFLIFKSVLCNNELEKREGINYRGYLFLSCNLIGCLCLAHLLEMRGRQFLIFLSLMGWVLFFLEVVDLALDICLAGALISSFFTEKPLLGDRIGLKCTFGNCAINAEKVVISLKSTIYHRSVLANPLKLVIHSGISNDV